MGPDMDKALLAAEAVDPAEVVDLLRALVRIPSHYPGPGEEGVVAFLEAYLGERGFKPLRQEAAPGRPNLVADLGEGEGGRLYGRGACDMKGGLAALVGAMLAVKRAFGRLPRPLRLAALADEEGMMLGVKAFVRAGLHHGFRGALAAEPEAEAPTVKVNTCGRGEKGVEGRRNRPASRQGHEAH